MNKSEVNRLIPEAYDALNAVGIAVDEEIKKTYRSALSAFGSAVIMGNPLSAIAFFDKATEKTEADRTKILSAISYMMRKTLFEKVEIKKDKNQKKFDLNSYEGSVKDLKELFLKSTDSNDLYKYTDSNDLYKYKNQLLESAVALKLACNLYKLIK